MSMRHYPSGRVALNHWQRDRYKDSILARICSRTDRISSALDNCRFIELIQLLQKFCVGSQNILSLSLDKRTQFINIYRSA